MLVSGRHSSHAHVVLRVPQCLECRNKRNRSFGTRTNFHCCMMDYGFVRSCDPNVLDSQFQLKKSFEDEEGKKSRREEDG